jgi:hypothetical protein
MQHDAVPGSDDLSPDSSPEDSWQAAERLFIDDPRAAVRNAHALVGDLIEKFLANAEADRMMIEHQWRIEDALPTDSLRQILLSYHRMFGQLMGMCR